PRGETRCDLCLAVRRRFVTFNYLCVQLSNHGDCPRAAARERQFLPPPCRFRSRPPRPSVADGADRTGYLRTVILRNAVARAHRPPRAASGDSTQRSLLSVASPCSLLRTGAV